MSTIVAHGAPEATLVELARTLSLRDLGGLPIVDASGELLGFVSATDVIGALLAGKAASTRAAEIMTSPAVTIDEFATSDEVMSVLRERHIHHLPVVRSGRLVGIISPKEILTYFVKRVAPTAPEAG